MKLHIIFAGVLALCATVSASCVALSRSNICGQRFLGDERWHAQFPNSRMRDVGSAAVEFQHFSSLFRLDNYCSHMLYNFLCFHYFPLCDPERPSVVVTPCREVCTEATAACLDHARAISSDFNFPAHLNCSNFVSGPSSSDSCGGVQGAQGEEDSETNSGGCTACPNATIHVEFATELGKSVFEGSESEGSAEVCLKLANVGSFVPGVTLNESVTVDIWPESQTADDSDYVAVHHTIHFPVGSPKGHIECINIQIIDDGLKEALESFVVSAVINDYNAIIGGAVDSSEDSIKCHIVDNDHPVMPEGECRKKCDWRTRMNRNTFKKNPYTFAARVEVIGCRESLLDVTIQECLERECDICPQNNINYSIPFCTDCLTNCPIGQEFIIAGRHSGGYLYVANYRKGGLFVPVSRISNSWRSWVPVSMCQ